MQQWEVRVNPDRAEGLREGDELTFFYPSTEWHMAQPFECLCKTEECVGWVRGARDMDPQVLGKYWMNGHIEGLLREKDGMVMVVLMAALVLLISFSVSQGKDDG